MADAKSNPAPAGANSAPLAVSTSAKKEGDPAPDKNAGARQGCAERLAKLSPVAPQYLNRIVLVADLERLLRALEAYTAAPDVGQKEHVHAVGLPWAGSWADTCQHVVS